MSPALLAALGAILGEIAAGILTVAEAVTALLEVGIVYTGAMTLSAISSYIASLIAGAGGTPVAFATAPVPTLAQPPTCVTGSPRHKGICCAAITQLGLARAAQGFQYTSCTGKTVCLACGTKQSTSVKHPGQTVFSVKRVSCGPSGCPALAQALVTPPI
jgi:hypothetical protein